MYDKLVTKVNAISSVDLLQKHSTDKLGIEKKMLTRKY